MSLCWQNRETAEEDALIAAEARQIARVETRKRLNGIARLCAWLANLTGPSMLLPPRTADERMRNSTS